MYSEITVIVEGAAEETETFADYALERDYIASLAREAEADGVEMEIYRIEHDHAMNVEDCACVQYLTDHRPAWTFPQDLDFFNEED